MTENAAGTMKSQEWAVPVHPCTVPPRETHEAERQGIGTERRCPFKQLLPLFNVIPVILGCLSTNTYAAEHPKKSSPVTSPGADEADTSNSGTKRWQSRGPNRRHLTWRGWRRSFASLSRNQSEKDLTTDNTDRTDKRSEMPFIRGISGIRGCSFLGPDSWPKKI